MALPLRHRMNPLNLVHNSMIECSEGCELGDATETQAVEFIYHV